MDMAVQKSFTQDVTEASGAKAVKVAARDVNVYYGDKHALKHVNVDVPDKGVMAFIGPSGCGKSTFLRCINRMNDTIPGCRVTGKIEIDKSDIYDPSLNPLYRDVLEHYGVVALPCQVRDPDRKGKVEAGVGHAKKTPLKGKRFESLEEAQAYLDYWEEHWADTRIHGTTKRQVAAMFAEEKPWLQALPLEPFRYYQYGDRTVHLESFDDFPGTSVVTMDLVEQGGKTTMTATVLYDSKEIRDAVIQSGMEHGAAARQQADHGYSSMGAARSSPAQRAAPAPRPSGGGHPAGGGRGGR